MQHTLLWLKRVSMGIIPINLKLKNRMSQRVTCSLKDYSSVTVSK